MNYNFDYNAAYVFTSTFKLFLEPTSTEHSRKQ